MDLDELLVDILNADISKSHIKSCKRCNKLFNTVVYNPSGAVKNSNKKQLYCSYSCGQKSRRKTNSYVKLQTEDGKKSLKEHRYVMENILGRKLFDHEHVHHKNGLKYDNSPDNLELWSISHPSGQRVEDKIKWCREFLKQYECQN